MAKKPEPPGPKPPLTGLLKVTQTFTGPGTPTPIAQNVLHARWADALNHTLADVQHVATAAFGAWVSSPMPSFMANAWVNTRCDVQSLGGDGIFASFTGSTPGSGGASTYPPQVAVCLSWQTFASWRGGKPRTYLPGIPSTATVAFGQAALSPTYATGLHSAATTWMGLFNAIVATGSNPILGFPSYYTHYTIRPTPLWFPFNGLVIHDRIDSQRRRSGKERVFGIS